MQSQKADNETLLVEKIKSYIWLVQHKKVHFPKKDTKKFNIEKSVFELLTQLTFTRWKSTIETLEKDEKYVQS